MTASSLKGQKSFFKVQVCGNQPEILLKADSDINSCHELDILFYMMAIQIPFFLFKYVYCSFEHWV